MDHIRTINERISFLPYNYEYTFFTPFVDRILVRDVVISTYGSPSLAHPGGRIGVSCNDIHLYIDGIDFTKLFIDALKANIDKRNAADVKKEYAFALEKWLELEEKMGAAYGTQDIQKEKQIVQQLLNTTPLSNVLNQLGDTKVGWGGNLHIINFLYNEIELEPVSLVKLVDKHNTLNATQIDKQQIKRITFSSGPCRLFSNDWNPLDVPTGGLDCLFEIRYHNLLEDRVEKLEHQMETLQTEISNSLVAIEEAIKIQTNERFRELTAAIQKNTNNISAAQNELKNHQLQLEALKDTTQEILKAIETI